jgi:hypothetical protein
VFGVGLAVLDVAVGLPWFWVVVEGPSIVAVGIVMLVLLRKLPP